MTFPTARKTQKANRRFNIIYCALQSVRGREIIEIVGAGRNLPQRGKDNAFLLELADIIDDALQREVERRRKAEG